MASADGTAAIRNRCGRPRCVPGVSWRPGQAVAATRRPGREASWGTAQGRGPSAGASRRPHASTGGVRIHPRIRGVNGDNCAERPHLPPPSRGTCGRRAEDPRGASEVHEETWSPARLRRDPPVPVTPPGPPRDASRAHRPVKDLRVVFSLQGNGNSTHDFLSAHFPAPSAPLPHASSRLPHASPAPSAPLPAPPAVSATATARPGRGRDGRVPRRPVAGLRRPPARRVPCLAPPGTVGRPPPRPAAGPPRPGAP